MREIKSPLRYPGGKSRAIQQIIAHLPTKFSEYREPFLGGGSLFVFLKQHYPDLRYWVNDLNFDLYCFWKCAQGDAENLLKEIWRIKRERLNGRELFEELTSLDVSLLSPFERAVRFFVLNRISFSGTVDAGGYSQKAFESRFTDSSIERLSVFAQILQGVRITNLDYQAVLEEPGEEVFIFLDPPYLTATKSRLYGKRGQLHTSFTHREFSQAVKQCPHQYLITYDNSSEIRRNFAFAYLYEWELQYGMNNYKQPNAAKGKELFIANYQKEPNNMRCPVQISLFR
jgi:DNA adenine methylase